MKKHSYMAWLVALLTLSLVGCTVSEESVQEAPATTTTSTIASATDSTTTVGDTTTTAGDTTTTVGDTTTSATTVGDTTTSTTTTTRTTERTTRTTRSTRGKSTTTATKGTESQRPVVTTPEQREPQLTITVEKAQNHYRVYKDPQAKQYNYSLKLTANVDLKHMRLVTIDPTTSTTGDLLMNMMGLKKGESQYLLTDIREAASNRGIVCVDEQGRASYFAMVVSTEDGSVELKWLKR